MRLGSRKSSFFVSNFFEYFYYFILVILMVTTLLGGSLYFYFSRTMKEQSLQINKNTLEQLKNAQQIILGEVDESFSNVLLSDALMNYTAIYRDKNEGEMIRAKGQMENILALNNYIYDLYIYYIDDDIVLASNRDPVKLNDFYDRDFDIKLKDLEPVNYHVVTRNIKTYGSDQNLEVATFVKPVLFKYDGKPLAFVVFNIKAFYLQEIIDSISLIENASIAVSDRQGNVIGLRKGSDPENVELFKKYLKENFLAENGYFEANLHGEKYIVSYSYSSRYNWVYMYSRTYSDMTKWLRFIGIMTLLMCVSVLGVSAIGSYFLSRRIYFPIKAIMSLFGMDSDRKTAGTSAAMKETEFIQQNVSNLIHQNHNLEKQLEDYRMMQKHVFIIKLLTGNTDYESSLNELLEYYHISIEPQGLFLVVMLSVDDYKSFIRGFNEKQKNMISVYLEDIAKREILTFYKGLTVHMGENNFYILLNWTNEENISANMDDLYDKIKNLHQRVSENMRCTFTVGVSSVQKGIGGISQCWLEAQAAVNYRLVMGYDTVIYYERMTWKDSRSMSYPYHLEQEVLQGLRTGDSTQVMDAMSRFISHMYQNVSDSIDDVRFYFLKLVASSFNLFYELELGSLEESGLFSTNIFGEILKEETMQGIAEHIKRLYNTVLKLKEEKKSSRNKELILSVKNYIKCNVNAELSVESIAEKYYVSTSYLRKVFKADENSTLKDYINEVKMQKAIELLEQTNKKVGDIAGEVGYFSVPAFIKAFKLYTTKTPSEYRSDFVIKNS